MVLFCRTQRASIYDRATFSDIPPEVLGESLLYFVDLGKRDLVSASLVCRAWYPVAQRLIMSKRAFNGGDNIAIEKYVCGLHTRALVGADILSIEYLSLNL